MDIFASQKSAYQRDGAIRVDVGDARAHQLRFGLPDGGEQRWQLAIDIAGRHHIVIHQRQTPYARARQGFCAIRADTAQTRDEDMLTAQLLDAIAAEQDLGAFELGQGF
jgi:hypothetical protein